MKRTLIGLALLFAATLSGCVVAPPIYQPVPPGIYPTAPYTGGVSVAPGAGYFWLDGLWLLNGGRRVWQPGRWEHRHPHNVWEAPHRSKHGGQH